MISEMIKELVKFTKDIINIALSDNKEINKTLLIDYAVAAKYFLGVMKDDPGEEVKTFCRELAKKNIDKWGEILHELQRGYILKETNSPSDFLNMFSLSPFKGEVAVCVNSGRCHFITSDMSKLTRMRDNGGLNYWCGFPTLEWLIEQAKKANTNLDSEDLQ